LNCQSHVWGYKIYQFTAYQRICKYLVSGLKFQISALHVSTEHINETCMLASHKFDLMKHSNIP